MDQADYKVVRTRSVDNLQRLYTVVVSLAITESLRHLIGGTVAEPRTTTYGHWLMFTSLLVTLVPFYHGANRYLDATYVTHERSAKRGALMWDFIALFLEGLGFFVIGALMQRGTAPFYTGIAALFVFDAIWVGLTNLTASGEEDRMPGYRKWALVNLLAAVVLFALVWSNLFTGVTVWRNEFAANIALVSVAILRTVYDYAKVWKFYYPKDVDLIPAPAPAPLPHVQPKS